MRKEGIHRSIYYYEWFTHSKNKETECLQRDENSTKIIEFLNGIYEKQLNCSNYMDFIINTSQGEEFIIIDNVDEENIFFRIVLCRENALPFIEKDGILSELGTVISNDQNLAEITHCVFFCKYGILGAEYNVNGARATAVSDYMVRLTNTDSIPNCRPKLNYDTYSKLIEGKTFSLLDFTVKTNSRAYIDLLSKKSIFSAIQATVPDSETIEVVLKKRKTKKNGMKGFRLPFSFEETKSLLTNYREDIDKFCISQGTGKDAIDLLSDKYVHRTYLLKTASRSIDSNYMYKIIVEYFVNNVQKDCT